MITPRPVRQSKNPMISPDSAIAFHVAGCAAAHTMMMMAKMKMTSLISGVGAGSDSLYDWPIRRLLHLSAKVERRMSLRTIARHSIRQTRAPPRTRCGCPPVCGILLCACRPSGYMRAPTPGSSLLDASMHHNARTPGPARRRRAVHTQRDDTGVHDALSARRGLGPLGAGQGSRAHGTCRLVSFEKCKRDVS
jgi:hypothetical protein